MPADGPNGGIPRTRRRLHRGAELILVAVPTAVVLLVLVLLDSVSRQHVSHASRGTGPWSLVTRL